MSMTQERYEKLMVTFLAAWPKDRVKKVSDTEHILTCDNGTFIKVARMCIPDEDFKEVTQSVISLMHNKLLIQWTDDLNKAAYKNLGHYIQKEEYPGLKEMSDALKELMFRVKIGDVLS